MGVRVRLWRFLLPAIAFVFPISPAPAQEVGSEFRVNTYTTSRQLSPRLACDPGGDFVVVWQSLSQQEGGSFASYGAFGQRYSSSGASLGSEFRVNTFTFDYQTSPCVASQSSGSFVVVWQSGQDGSLDGIFGQRYGSAGAPLGTEFRVNTYTTGNQRNASVASDADGNVVVVWQSDAQDGSSMGIFGQRYGSTGGPRGTEFRVNTYTTDFQNSPSVASDSGGNFVVVWQSFSQEGASVAYASYGVFGQRYGSAGAPLGAEFRMNSYTTGGQTLPSITSDSGESFVVVWTSFEQDLDGDGVFGQRYGSAGAPFGTEFRVNSYQVNYQSSPFVASGPGGSFVVAWQSFDQDGSHLGVFGQRFCPALGSVTISVDGLTTVCKPSTGGTATVTDDGGGLRTHEWDFRTTSQGSTTPIAGQTGTSYLISGTDFLGAGTYYLVCITNPECGKPTVSNEIVVTVYASADDMMAPTVTPPAALAGATQTICM